MKYFKYILFNAICFLFFLFSISFVYYHSTKILDNKIQDNIISMLKDVSSNDANMVNVILNEAVSNIESIGVVYSKDNKETITKEDLIQIAEDYSFKNLSFVDENNVEYFSDGSTVENSSLNLRSDIENGIAGINYDLNNRYNLNNMLFVYAPITYNNGKLGIIKGFFSDEFIYTLLNNNYYGNEGISFIVNKDNVIIAGSKALENSTDTYALVNHRNDVITDDTGEDGRKKLLVEFDGAYGRNCAYVVDLGLADTLFVEVFPANSIKLLRDNFKTTRNFIIISLTVISLCYIGILTVLGFKKHRKIIFANRTISEKEVLESTLLYKANHDELTSSLNRFGLEEIIKNNLIYNELVMAIIDIDFFKNINDENGHDVGDEILVKTSDTIKKYFPGGYLVRLGGDEFCLILNEEKPFDDDILLDRFKYINESLSKLENGVSISVGIVKSHNGYNSKLFKQADEILYEIKNTSRGRCVIKEANN